MKTTVERYPVDRLPEDLRPHGDDVRFVRVTIETQDEKRSDLSRLIEAMEKAARKSESKDQSAEG